MGLPNSLISTIEKETGLSIDKIRSMTPHETREYFEKKHGSPMKFSVGKLLPTLLSNEEVEAMLDAALKD